jgi:Na+-driven multidrug efflux pump
MPTFTSDHYRPRAVRLRSEYDREIFRLAIPALGALAAEPLYILADTAIVGHLGRPQIAALGLAGVVLSGAFTIFNFLTYGTTALVALAGQGYLRGISNLRRPLVIVVAANGVNLVLELLFVYGFHWGISGSAAGTAIAQAGMGVAFAAELLRPHARSKRPSMTAMRPMLRVGRQIFVRTTALYASFLAAASVCARMGDAQLGAHQIGSQLFFFLALLLDSVAIAGQVLVGRALGAGDADAAYNSAIRMIGWSVAVGTVFALVLLPLAGVVPHGFSGDHAVLQQTRELWPYFALMQPLGGAVFALDGILIGASDTAYLMWSMLAASAVFIVLAVLALERSRRPDRCEARAPVGPICGAQMGRHRLGLD